MNAAKLLALAATLVLLALALPVGVADTASANACTPSLSDVAVRDDVACVKDPCDLDEDEPLRCYR